MRREELLHLRPALLCHRQVHFGGDDYLRSLGQGGIEAGEFVIQRRKVCPGGATLFLGAQVEQMHQETRALNMFEEVESQTLALVRPRNQAWNIGNDTGGILRLLHHTQVWRQRRKRIVSDFRPSG